MNEIQKYRIEQINQNEFALVIYLNNNQTEFASELGTRPEQRRNILDTAKGIVSSQYPKLKVTIVKVVLGGMVVTSFQLADNNSAASAQAIQPNQHSEMTSSSIYYQVSSGDTLWLLSRKFDTSVQDLKRANQLTSDVLSINQSIIIPKAFHTVKTGDYLSVLARDYGVTTKAIREANQLKSDAVQLGQTLIIPVVFGSTETEVTSPTVQQPMPKTYSVTAGDSLSVIAERFGVTTEALRTANGLSSDLIRIGQVLNIPSGTAAPTPSPAPSPTPTESTTVKSYTVVSGDSLSVIAERFGVTTEALRTANGLSSDLIRVGQVLNIPSGTAAPTPSPAPSPAPTESTTAKSYTVVSGDSLSVIAERFGVTTEALRTANGLPSDLIRVGQVLNIPSGTAAPTPSPAPSPTPTESTTAKSYTVVSGDSLSVIAERFGVTTEALRTTNALKSDLIQVGQVLTIPSGPAVSNPSPPPSPEPAPAPTETPAPSSYTVASGDNLWVIANRFGVSIDALRSANQLKTDVLQPGQILSIPSASQGVAPSTPENKEEARKTFTYRVISGDSISVIAARFGVSSDDIRKDNNLKTDALQIGQALTITNGLNAPSHSSYNTITYKTHTIVSGDNIWDLSVRYGIPQAELLKANNLTTSSRLSIGQQLKIPVHNIGVKETISAKHGEMMDWWTEAQYVFTIGKTAKVTDFLTGKSFYIKRTIGANHADSETVSVTDTNVAKSIWGGFSWTPRAVILEIDGRKIAASMSFMPHEREYIANNGITGHFDVYFGNSTRHVDGKADASHQAQVEKAAGLR